MRTRLVRIEILVGLTATLLSVFFLSPHTLAGAVYPGLTWTTVKPEDHNWSSGKLNEAWLYAQSIGSVAKLTESPAWKRILEFREKIKGQAIDSLRIYRIAPYAHETYYYLEVLAGNRPLAIRCGLNEAGQIVYLNTID